jgi:hypothetical protein
MGRAVTPLAGGAPSESWLGRWRALGRRVPALAARAISWQLTACSAAPAEPAAVPAPANDSADAASVASRGARARLVCQALGSRERTRELSARGRAQLAASREGEHFASAGFEPAMALLREAAHGGERLAQSVYGKTRFSTLFQLEAPRPEQREAYVEALTFWRTAALAEPDLTTSGITAATPVALEFPLSELPAPWLQEAWARSSDWIRCHGLPW